MVYGLGNKGMKLLEREKGISNPRFDWIARNRSITRFFMEHTLAVADVMVALELSCRKKDIELIHPLTCSRDSFKWSVSIRHGAVTATFGVVPDRVIGLRDGHSTRWLFLEADRGTMPVERKNLKQTSYYRQLIAYRETWRQKILQNSFPRFQVLTVTTTRDRVANLLQATRRLTQSNGAGMFLFADHEAFVSADDVLQIRLVNGRDEKVTLLN